MVLRDLLEKLKDWDPDLPVVEFVCPEAEEDDPIERIYIAYSN